MYKKSKERKHSAGKELQGLSTRRKRQLTSKNGDRKTVQSIRITSRSFTRIRNRI